nr:disease resistance protein RPP13-like isoform X6 [Ipomoea batatas]
MCWLKGKLRSELNKSDGQREGEYWNPDGQAFVETHSRIQCLQEFMDNAIVAIEEALVKIKNEYKLQETKKTALDDVPRYSSQPPASDSDNKMVGKDEEFEIIVSNLEKLTLRNTNFEWKGINILSSLPKLRVLKLFFFACVGEEWEMEDEVFSQLIYLEINSIDLKQWKAGSHNFPELERLLLYRCKKLEEIPPDFGEIQNLKLIELKGCLTSVVDSAKQIETDQRDCGNDDMIVIEENAIQQAETIPQFSFLMLSSSTFVNTTSVINQGCCEENEMTCAAAAFCAFTMI